MTPATAPSGGPATARSTTASQREVARRLGVSHTALLAAPSAGASGFHNARTANEVLKAQERKLRLEERRGQLVDKARALLLVHRLAKEEREAILAWPARVAAELAAELGVDAHRLQTLLDARLRQHLAERHDVRVSVG
jgi:transcriptional regulator with XRE-family HTH domain